MKLFEMSGTRVLTIFTTLLFTTASLQAADGIPAGSIVFDVAAQTITLGSQVEPLEPLGNNSKRCQIDQSSATDLLQFTTLSGGGEPSISLQRSSIGQDTTNGQGCGFADGGETYLIALGTSVNDTLKVGSFSFDFIVTDDAVFELTVFDADGNPQFATDPGAGPTDPPLGYSYRVATGRNGCDPIGTQGDPLTPAHNEITQFACSAQSNPNSAFSFEVTQASFDEDVGEWHSIEGKSVV